MTKYKCEVCNKAYQHRRSLITHKKYSCKNKNQFKCSDCSHQCSLFHNLKTHLMVKHGYKKTMKKDFYMIYSTKRIKKEKL